MEEQVLDVNCNDGVVDHDGDGNEDHEFDDANDDDGEDHEYADILEQHVLDDDDDNEDENDDGDNMDDDGDNADNEDEDDGENMEDDDDADNQNLPMISCELERRILAAAGSGDHLKPASLASST